MGGKTGGQNSRFWQKCPILGPSPLLRRRSLEPREVFHDRQGAVWVGLQGAGFDPGAWKRVKPLIRNGPFSMIREKLNMGGENGRQKRPILVTFYD